MSVVEAIKKVEKYNLLKSKLDTLKLSIEDIEVSIKRYKKDVLEHVDVFVFLGNNEYLKTKLNRKKYISVLNSILKEKNKELIGVTNELENL